MNSIIGAVFPISPKHVSKIFNEGKTVFVKYTNMSNFEKNSKIIFYVSKEKRLIGEGLIDKIEKLSPEDAWSRYHECIFLDEMEYNQYVSWSAIEKKKRKDTEVTVFVLKNLRKYDQPYKLKHGISPSGFYMGNVEYNELLHNAALKENI